MMHYLLLEVIGMKSDGFLAEASIENQSPPTRKRIR
jgi:hypothetical protein